MSWHTNGMLIFARTPARTERHGFSREIRGRAENDRYGTKDWGRGGRLKKEKKRGKGKRAIIRYCYCLEYDGLGHTHCGRSVPPMATAETEDRTA